MDAVRRQASKNPKETANLLSKLLFVWIYRIIYQGSKKDIEENDIPQPVHEDMSAEVGDTLERRWFAEIQNASKKKRSPSLLKAVVKQFGCECFLWGFVYFTNEALNSLIRPYFLGRMLTYFMPGSSVTRETAIISAAAIVIINFTSSLLMEQYLIGSQVMGLRARAACVSLVYRKCLRLSLNALGDSSAGQIVNLISNDVSRFELVSILVNCMWAAPLISIILAVILFYQVGIPGLIGMAVLFAVVPIQLDENGDLMPEISARVKAAWAAFRRLNNIIKSSIYVCASKAYTGKLTSKYRLQIALRTDERVRLMNEVICGMQVIKMYAWEKPYIALVNAARKLELKILRKTSYLRGLFMAFNLFTTRVALCCTLLATVLSGGKLSADMVFVMSAYFAQLSMSMTALFVRGFAEVAECLVSIKRLQTFLLKEECKLSAKHVSTKEVDDKSILHGGGSLRSTHSNISNIMDYIQNTGYVHYDNMIELEDVDAKWNPGSSDYTLDGISLKIKPGELVGIIGTVGSGKSSLLELLLGELPVCSGKVAINGTISYASQEPWIFAGSIKQNILFGLPYDTKRYRMVTKVCALQRDFQLLPRGDMTLVGERGASLSGGQKARINLARAIYKQADIYLLDDPLSAVDAHVGKHLFKGCIEGFLRGKTTVLVTHQLQHLISLDHLVILNNGAVEMQGSYVDLLRSGIDYMAALIEDEEKEVEDEDDSEMCTKRRTFSRSSVKSTVSSIAGDINFYDYDPDQTERERECATHIPCKELYLNYIKSGSGYCYITVIVLLVILTQLLASTCDYWVAYWIKLEEKRTHNAEGTGNMWPSIYFSSIHGGIVICLFVFAVLRGIIFYNGCLRSSKGIHSNMVTSIVGTSLKFYHNNPSGRILNRFSKDLGSVDEILPRAILDCLQMSAQILGAVVLTSTVNPWLLLPAVIIAILTIYIQRVFVKTSKNLKRIEGIARSPVFSHLNATLQGLTTIRAHNAQKLVKEEFDNYQDLHTGTTFLYYSATGAFAFALDIVCNVYIGIATLSFLFFQDDSYGANAGLTITQSLSIALFLQWFTRQSAEVSNQMTSTERVIEYIKFKPEEDKTENETILPNNWPLVGHIEMKNVYLKYDDEETPVLKDVNISILPGQKIGIVGRTGAGKSSLITALFRLAKVEGLITIDDVDTSKLTLKTLRSHISIIPQDPVLFSGTLRRNLDPFGIYPDYDLWRVLDEVKMRENFSEIEGFGLESRVMDCGCNFSVGQRQLICLARAILRNNKILVLDEATANVDPHTDALIQSTIRRKFSGCTVLTIAHRLNTIMDSDEVLVMDSGSVVEFDHPLILLSKKTGFFYSLVHETGKSMALHLTELARENFCNNYRSQNS